MAIFGIVVSLLNIAVTALSGGAIPSNIATLITSLDSVVLPAIQNIASGQGKLQDVITALGTLTGVIGVLKQQTNLDPKVAAQINALDVAVQAGINAYLQAQVGVDLTKLGPVQPIA